MKMHCCLGRRHDVTCSRGKCYIMCGHNIIYDMKLVKSYDKEVSNAKFKPKTYAALLLAINFVIIKKQLIFQFASVYL